MSAQSVGGVSGLVAINSLMAMVGGIAVAAIISRADPGFVHNGALAGLVAVCAGSDVFHPIGALVQRPRYPAHRPFAKLFAAIQHRGKALPGHNPGHQAQTRSRIPAVQRPFGRMQTMQPASFNRQIPGLLRLPTGRYLNA
jgi:hypothetical protein